MWRKYRSRKEMRHITNSERLKHPEQSPQLTQTPHEAPLLLVIGDRLACPQGVLLGGLQEQSGTTQEKTS